MAAGFITAAICVEMTENFFFFFLYLKRTITGATWNDGY